jgi:hypothetical protein
MGRFVDEQGVVHATPADGREMLYDRRLFEGVFRNEAVQCSNQTINERCPEPADFLVILPRSNGVFSAFDRPQPACHRCMLAHLMEGKDGAQFMVIRMKRGS